MNRVIFFVIVKSCPLLNRIEELRLIPTDGLKLHKQVYGLKLSYNMP